MDNPDWKKAVAGVQLGQILMKPIDLTILDSKQPINYATRRVLERHPDILKTLVERSPIAVTTAFLSSGSPIQMTRSSLMNCWKT